MKIKVEKYFLGTILIGLVLIGIVGVVAYNFAGIGGNPAVFGHSVDEIDWSKNISGNVSSGGFCLNGICLSDWSGIGTGNGNYWISTNGGIQYTGRNVSANGFCIGTNCITSWQTGTFSQWASSVGGGIYYDGGNVGLGISSPPVKLDILGDLMVDGMRISHVHGNNVTCPAGSVMLAGKWAPRTCVAGLCGPDARYSCTTGGGWGEPQTCGFYSPGCPSGMPTITCREFQMAYGTCNHPTLCTSNSWNDVLCVGG